MIFGYLLKLVNLYSF